MTLTNEELDKARAEKAREWMEYRSDLGGLVWKVRANPAVTIGDRIGCDSGHGYRSAHLLGRRCYEHQLVWAYFTGEWPSSHIDHIDGDRCNNRIENLRAVSNAENCQNRRRHRHNSTGYTGVKLDKRRGTYSAEITVDMRRVYLGVYSTAEDASAAYQEAKSLLHPFAEKKAQVAHG